MTIREILLRIKEDSACTLFPACGKPLLHSEGLVIPDDLAEFYELCGGANLFTGSDWGFRILPPSEFVQASPCIQPLVYEEMRSEFDSDISSAWYLFGRSNGPEENLIIDTHPSRSGFCYDGYIGTYATSDCRIISRSFTDCLARLVEAKGESLYWARKSFGREYIYLEVDAEPPLG
jgi:antitoxin YokJ